MSASQAVLLGLAAVVALGAIVVAAMTILAIFVAAPLGGVLWWTARRDYPWNWRLLVPVPPSYFRWLNTPQGMAAKERVRRR